MIMKFKRGDFGLYFSLGVAGAGIGLLVGAFIANRRRKAPDFEKTYIPFDGLDIVVDEPVDGNPPVAHLRKPKTPVKEQEEVVDPELTEFIEEYEPPNMMISLIQSGFLTIEEAKAQLDEEIGEAYDADTRYAYEAPYRPTNDNKPDLSELVSPETTARLLADDLLDERFVVIRGEADELAAWPEFLYIPEAEGGPMWSYLSSKGTPLNTSSITKYVSHKAWVDILPILMEHGNLYVEDISSETLMRFYLDEDASGRILEEDDE